MRDVFIKQSTTRYTGTTLSPIDTSSDNFGYYTVPLQIRNTKYPSVFASLPSAQVNFPLIDDEVPLDLGEKIDYKDYFSYTDQQNNNQYVIVNPVTRDELANNKKYKKIGQNENGQVIPPPRAGMIDLRIAIPRLSVSTNTILEKNPKLSLPAIISVPVVIPVVNINGQYQLEAVSIANNKEVEFNLVQYKDLFEKETKFAAVNITL